VSTVVETRGRRAPWREQLAGVGRQVGLPVLGAIVVLALVSVCVGLLVTRVLDGVIGGFDLDLSHTLVNHRTAALDRLTAALTVPADTIAVSVVWAGAVVLAAWRTRSVLLPAFLVAVVGGEKLTYLITTEIVRRPRPPVPPLGHVFATSSFPSGHIGSVITLYGGIVLAFLCYDAVARRSRHSHAARIGLCVVAVFAVLVGFSRVYRGHHYLSDVVWGAVLGVTWLTFAWHLLTRAATSNRQVAAAGRAAP
jgi:undecaprenyl-diphosphatase